jgi:UDP-2-acetamido-2-deoxy-ribo-hexuluronate aminotransferase
MSVIQMYDPKREYKMHKSEIDNSIQTVLNHGLFIDGPEVKELESKLANYVGTKYCIAVSNGTDAIKIALLALDVKPGDEVITVAHTWISSAEVISIINAIPVFVDIEQDTFNMDYKKLRNAITQKTKAIVLVSLYGQVGDIDEINKIANEYNIPVIEDAAQSFGAMFNGKRSCNLSTIGTTSFFPSKPLGCYGDGGACFTNDESIATKIRAIKSHGGLKRFHHEYIGMNGRLDTLQAAILLSKFNYIDDTLKNRNKCAEYYNENLKEINKLKIPVVKENRYHVWAQYSLLCENKEVRDNLVNYMKENGVNVAVFYPVPLHYQNCFKNKSIVHDLSITENIADRVFNLPCYGELMLEEQEKIVNLVKKFYN